MSNVSLLGPLVRPSVLPSSRRLVPCLGVFLASLAFPGSHLRAQQVVVGSAHREAERALPQTATIPAGSPSADTLKQKLAASRTGISLVVADFDNDSTPDLISGYATTAGGLLLLQRGSKIAQAPGPNEWEMLKRGDLVTPYVATSEAIDVPVRPDMLKTADIAGHGQSDLLLAARGDSAVWLLPATGHGTFLAARALTLAGPISALGTWRGPAGQILVAAAVCGGAGCGVQFLDRDGKTAGFVATSGKVASVSFARVNGGGTEDLLAIAGGRALLVDGDSILSAAPRVQQVGPAKAAAIISGSFIYTLDWTPQLAVLGEDATLHIFDRAALNPHQPTEDEMSAAHEARRLARKARQARPPTPSRVGMSWLEVETTPNFGPGAGSGHAILLNGHMTATGQDDVTLLAAGQFLQLTHPSHLEGDVQVTTPILTVDSTAEPVTAAVTARVSADGRLGLVSLGRTAQPQVAIPSTYHTFTVNSTADATPTTALMNLCTNGSAGCELRSALENVYNDAATNRGGGRVDTVNIAAGTYTESATNSGATKDYNGDVDYHFNVNGPVNIVGASQATTIINANSKDNVFDIDSSTNGSVRIAQTYFLAFLSNMTIENGVNNDDPYANRNSYNYVGGLVDWQAQGGTTSSLTINAVTMTNGVVKWGPGGCIGVQSYALASVLEIDNSTMTGCSTPEQGGGIYVNDGPLILTGSTIANNVANSSVNPTDDSADGYGGGFAASLSYFPPQPNTDTLTNDTFSGNSAGDHAGGVFEANQVVMTGTTFVGNTSAGFAGGLEVYAGANSTVTTSTFTTNTAQGGDGGGICYDPFATGYTLTCRTAAFMGIKLPAAIPAWQSAAQAGLVQALRRP